MKALAHLRYLLVQNPLTLVAVVLALALVVAAILGPSLAPYDPLATNTLRALSRRRGSTGVAPIRWGEISSVVCLSPHALTW